MAEEKKGGTGNSKTSGGSSGLGTAAEYSVIGFVFPLALVIGFFLGRWVGGLLGGPTAGIVVGVLLGAAAGFWNLYSSLQRLERREAARRNDGPGAGGPEGRAG